MHGMREALPSSSFKNLDHLSEFFGFFLCNHHRRSLPSSKGFKKRFLFLLASFNALNRPLELANATDFAEDHLLE